MALYLYVNAALYLLFAVWSTVSPLKTARTIGYEALSTSGRSEFLVVYGGLELGMAAMFAYMAATPQLQRPGVLIALLFYVPIVLYRIVTVLKFWPVRPATLYVGSLELFAADRRFAGVVVRACGEHALALNAASLQSRAHSSRHQCVTVSPGSSRCVGERLNASGGPLCGSTPITPARPS